MLLFQSLLYSPSTAISLHTIYPVYTKTSKHHLEMNTQVTIQLCKQIAINLYTVKVFIFVISVFLPSLGSPVPSPQPLIPALTSLLGPLGSVLQTVVTGGGATGATGVVSAQAGGAAILPIAAGGATAAVPAVAMMSALLPGIALGLFKGIFLGSIYYNI